MNPLFVTVRTVVRTHSGQVAVEVAPPAGIDLQFIYRAALSIYWNPGEALLEDRSRAVESTVESAARMARALREEYALALRPSDSVQWKDFSAEERKLVASALFGQACS
jgi:hypothetical protein